MSGPSPWKAAWSMLRVLIRVKRPISVGEGSVVDHGAFAPVLASLRDEGTSILPRLAGDIDHYITYLSTVDPEHLARDEALAYWLNLYNAGALRLAAQASASGGTSVLRIPGGFARPTVTIGNERLSLDAIEHAKIRRFGDPRIHGALVCGSISCPTLRSVPYDGVGLERQLDDQLTFFLASGGAVLTSEALLLSRIFLWYGGDFVRPSRMPVLLPAPRRAVARSLLGWLPIDAANAVTANLPVAHQRYDWGLSCAVG